MSTATPTPCCQSLETHSFRGSMMPSVRSRRPIPTWTFQTLKWRIKLKRPSWPLLQMTRTTSLLRLMVKVKGSQPQLYSSLTRPISLSQSLLLRPPSRQPFNPSQSNRRMLQPKHSYLHVFIYFCSAFFFLENNFIHHGFCVNNIVNALLIFCYVTICGIHLYSIFMYEHGGPSILWTCQIFNPHRVRLIIRHRSILNFRRGRPPLWTCQYFNLVGSVHFVDLLNI